MPEMITIRNRNTRKEFNVTERDWEVINSNPQISGLYSRIDPLPKAKEETKGKTK